MIQQRTLLLALTLLGTSCGSGIFSGIWASSRGRDNPTPPSPAVSLASTSAPLWNSSQSPVLRQVVISNYRFEGSNQEFEIILKSDELAAELAARFPGEGFENGVAQLVTAIEVGGNDTVATFRVETAPIFTVIAESGLRDLVVDLLVLAGGVPVGKATRFRLYRPPEVQAHLLQFLDAIPTVPRQMLLRHLTSDKVEDLDVVFFIRDYDQPGILNGKPNPNAVRLVRALFKEFPLPATPDPDDPAKFSAVMNVIQPPYNFPGKVNVSVLDKNAGWSITPVEPLYRASIQGVHPSILPADQESDVVLWGAGLVFTENKNGIKEYDFDRIELILHKGGRFTKVPATSIVQGSSSEKQIFFAAPPSPDGLPGIARLELKQTYLTNNKPLTFSTFLPDGGLRYATGTPVLGPLVNLLPKPGFDLGSGKHIKRTVNIPDLVLMSKEDEIAQLRVLQNCGAGLFSQAGKPVRTATSTFEAGRNPLGLSSLLIDNDNLADVVVVGGRAGSGAKAATHAILTATDSLEAPFALDTRILATSSPVAAQVAADFDNDGKGEVVVLPDPTRTLLRPEVWTGLGTNPVAVPVTIPAGIHGSALHVADLNGDRNADLAVATDGLDATDPYTVYVAIGNGKGGFVASLSYKLDYGPAQSGIPAKEEILALLSVSSGTASRRHLLVVTKGIDNKPRLIPFFFDAKTGKHAAVQKVHVLEIDLGGPARSASVMDQDRDRIEEILVGLASTASVPIQSFSLATGKAPVPFAFPSESGIKDPTRFVPDVLLWKPPNDKAWAREPALNGLLVLHKQALEGGDQAVVSAFPDMGGGLGSRQTRLEMTSPPEGLRLGDLDGDGRRDDCVTLMPSECLGHVNSGPGIFGSSSKLADVSSPLTRSLVTMPHDSTGDLVCWLEQPATGTVDLKARFPNGTVKSASLKDFVSMLNSNQGARLATDTRLIAVDGNMDKIPDLAVVFIAEETGGQGIGGLVFFLRGYGPNSGGFPFAIPKPKLNPGTVLRIPPLAREPSAGNLLAHSPARSPGIELVVAVGSSLEFLTLDLVAPGQDRFSTLPKLEMAFTSNPRHPLITELDKPSGEQGGAGASFEELVVLVGDRLQVFRNFLDDPNNGKLILSEDLSFPGQNPIGLAEGDFDGDGLGDILLVAKRFDKDLPLVSLFRGKRLAKFQQAYVYPDLLLGGESPKSFEVMDLDGNGLMDLILGRFPLLSR
ncbi:MAG: FG-GAP repeat domain-containing protein [Planctomycetota bacterium]